MKEENNILKVDGYLRPYLPALNKRKRKIFLKELEFTDARGRLCDYVNNHHYYGLHQIENEWVFREKAPHARRIFLYGDFSAWQLDEKYELYAIGNGDWELKLPIDALKVGMLYKLWMFWDQTGGERIPAYCQYVVQDEISNIFSAKIVNQKSYLWKYPSLTRKKNYFIYEAHVGMSSHLPQMNSYVNFTEFVLPRIKKLGYNAVQLMAIMEHPYYASFGYQVSNFFAPSSRFGTPDELKKLIDKAHELDIAVILDIVHSHAVSNEKEGLAFFDGTNSLYFYPDPKGHHPVWDSRCFDYGKPETLSFLLSNVKYWMEEFRFDGLRFDGVTSMTYWNHGIGVDFVNYSQYFDTNVDEDALVYLALANKVMHQVNTNSISIAEDVSGMPCLSYPIEQGGIGFDFRMSMGIADFWKKTIATKKDEEWNVNEIFFRLTDKRPEENTISYAESHDQAMVGDKPILFSLVDKEIYFSMAVETNNLVIDRGIALHKLIRFLTLSLANGGYLNFMGNEFGHPEWIDFPREGNQWSYQYALRRWDLADDELLKYHFLKTFDEALVHCAIENNILENSPRKYYEHLKDQLLCFGRGKFIFIVNLHPSKSFSDYAFPVPEEGIYAIILNSDARNVGGFGNIDDTIIHSTTFFNGAHHLKLYCPSRTAMILKKI